MKKIKSIFMIPLCLSILCGCSNLGLKYYKEEKPSIINPNQENKNQLEDFFENSITTYTDNVNSVTLSTLYEKCKKSTVTIEIYVTYTRQGLTSNESLYSTGSGFIIGESENYLYIYTNAHVVDVGKSSSILNVETEVILSNYNRYTASVVSKDIEEDVAIIKIDKPSSENYLVADIGDVNELKIGDSVFAIGSPLGLNYASTITEGIISGKNIPEDTDNNQDGVDTTMYLLQTDAVINPGNSGGPLFNYNGQVIGVNTMKIIKSESGTAIDGMGFAIPINHFKSVADTIINGDLYARPKVGITIRSIPQLSKANRDELSINVQKGLYIEEVTNPDSPLIAKTIITHINSKQIATFSEFSVELYSYKKGQTISITYCDLNGENPVVVNVILI